MIRYLRKLAAFLLALLLPFAAVVGVAVFSPDETFADSIMYSAHYKVDLLQTTPGPRIIFAGGSASTNAVVCQQVAQAAGRPAICTGVTAYLGLDFYLDQLLRYAAAGDTVVLMPENVLLRTDAANYELLWRAAGGDADVWAAIPPAAWPGMAMTAFAYCRTKLPQGWRPWDGGLQWPDYTDPHIPEGFGPLGDVVRERPQSQLASGYNTEDLIALDGGSASAPILRRLRRFADTMAQRGVQVLFAYPPLDPLCLTSTPEQNAAFAAAVEAGLGLPVLVTWEEALMEPAYFFDSNNHLTSPGAALYTATLVERLVPRLA